LSLDSYDDTIYSINVAANGDILLAGALADAGQDLRAVVVRLDSGGDLVTAFGSGGVLAFQVDSETTGIRAAVLRDDRLYVTGSVADGRYFLAAVYVDPYYGYGYLDSGFATGGIFAPQAPDGYVWARANAPIILFRRRFLHTNLDVWMSWDPLGYPDGANTYTPMRGDAVGGVDPLGLWSLARWIYTGDGYATDAMYSAALGGAADSIITDGGRKVELLNHLGPLGTLTACSIEYAMGPEATRQMYRGGQGPMSAQQQAYAMDRALMAQDVYNDELKGVPNWEIVGGKQLPSNLKYAVYRNAAGRHALVFKGTQPTSIADWRTNLAQGMGLEAAQYEEAIQLANEWKAKVGGENLELVGHSLGGGLASTAALVTGLHATVFNPAGVHLATLTRHGKDMSRAGELIQVYRVAGEVLTTLQDSLIHSDSFAMPDTAGNVTTLVPPTGVPTFPLGLLEAVQLHGMPAVLDALKDATR
jgi:hypothetical protein